MKVDELNCEQLDQAVLMVLKPLLQKEVACTIIPKFSSKWKLGGPIIEQEGIEISPALGFPDRLPLRGWYAGRSIDSIDLFSHEAFGETALIAAMRVFVKLKFGDEIELPNL